MGYRKLKLILINGIRILPQRQRERGDRREKKWEYSLFLYGFQEERVLSFKHPFFPSDSPGGCLYIDVPRRLTHIQASIKKDLRFLLENRWGKSGKE